MRYPSDREIIKDVYYLCQNTVNIAFDRVMCMPFKDFIMLKEITSEHIMEKKKAQEQQEREAKEEADKMRKKKK